MLGIVANAATYNWSVVSGWTSPDDNSPWEGATVYAFDANVNASAAVLQALTEATDGGAATFAKAMGSGVVNDGGEFKIEGTGLTDKGAATSPSASMYALLIAEKGNESYAYLIDSASDVVISSAINAGATAVFDMGDVVTGDVGGTGWSAAIGSGATPTPGPGPDPVPEPTSGILLMLGMAGLALRRRNA